jgi:hypothetical protein
LHGGVVQPDVGDVEAGEDAVWRRFPSDAEQDGLVAEGFFAIGGPCAFSDEFVDAEAFTTAPDARGGIEGHFLFRGLGIAALLRFAGGDDEACFVLEVHFFELPDNPSRWQWLGSSSRSRT